MSKRKFRCMSKHISKHAPKRISENMIKHMSIHMVALICTCIPIQGSMHKSIHMYINTYTNANPFQNITHISKYVDVYPRHNTTFYKQASVASLCARSYTQICNRCARHMFQMYAHTQMHKGFSLEPLRRTSKFSRIVWTSKF